MRMPRTKKGLAQDPRVPKGQNLNLNPGPSDSKACVLSASVVSSPLTWQQGLEERAQMPELEDCAKSLLSQALTAWQGEG